MYIFPVCTNSVAVFVNAINCLAFTNPALTISSNVILKCGDLAQQVCFRYTHQVKSEGAALLDPWIQHKVPAGLRIFSAGTGMGFDVAGYFKESPPGAIVTGVFGGLSMSSLGLALGLGKLNTLAY